MSNYLNRTILEAMSREARQEYYQNLVVQIGNTSVYLAQLREVMEQEGDFGAGHD